jgi:methionyl-tRNA synthetase
LASLSRQLARQIALLAPFMPEKAQAAWEQIGGPGWVADQRISTLGAIETAGWRVRRGDPLFPKPVAPRT